MLSHKDVRVRDLEDRVFNLEELVKHKDESLASAQGEVRRLKQDAAVKDAELLLLRESAVVR